MEFSHERDIPRLKELAKKGVNIGTSSWIYEGWLGSLYQGNYSGPRSKVNKKELKRLHDDGAFGGDPLKVELYTLCESIGDDEDAILAGMLNGVDLDEAKAKMDAWA
jgi:hypothetical protein